MAYFEVNGEGVRMPFKRRVDGGTKLEQAWLDAMGVLFGGPGVVMDADGAAVMVGEPVVVGEYTYALAPGKNIYRAQSVPQVSVFLCDHCCSCLSFSLLPLEFTS